MARFVGHREALRARAGAGDVVADRGHAGTRLSRTTSRVLRAWRRRCFVFRFLRLLDAWHLRHAILQWRNGVRILTDGERTIAQVLLLWRFGWHARFLRWHMATDAPRHRVSQRPSAVPISVWLGGAGRKDTATRGVSQPRAPRHARLRPLLPLNGERGVS